MSPRKPDLWDGIDQTESHQGEAGRLNLWEGINRKFSASPDVEEKEVRGRVEVMFHSDPEWSAGKLVTDSGRIVHFNGPLLSPGDVVVLRGAWVCLEKYGWRFKAASFNFNQEMSVVGLAQYLENHPDMVGIGPAKARLIAETFKGDFARVIDEQPELVEQVAKLSPEAVKRLREGWLSKRDVNVSLTWLAEFGLTHHQSTLLIEKYGNSVVKVLKEDPYSIVGQVPGLGFKRTDEIARERFGIASDDPRRIRAAILYCIADRRNDKGDCWVEYESLLDIVQGEDVLEAELPDLVVRACHELVKAEKLVRLVFDNKIAIADPFLYQQECDLAEAFLQCGENTKQISVEGMDVRLNEGQRSAVFAALQDNLLVLTGGAGSGKTFTIAAIVDLYERAGLRVVLTAPTGKAARRMEELVKHSAQTIHRLLKYNGRAFSEDLIPADVVIVDEVSMVDVPLAWHLFRAIDFSTTNVVLVGDHNQLPPIGPGNVLRDLVARRPIPTVVLETVVRQAGVLKENSNAILKGEVRPTSEPEDGRMTWILADEDKFKDPLVARRFIFDLFETFLVEDYGFDLLKDVQLLTPMKIGPLGTNALNIELQRIVQKKLWDVDVRTPQLDRPPELLLHDRVIQTRNNYKIGVMNGTIGTVTSPLIKGRLTVRFDDREVEIGHPTSSSNDLSLAYALTFHKCQGSEFPCAVVVIHRDHVRMHHRNLFYTGVTRAREVAIIVGDPQGIRACAKKVQVDDRKTFLSLLDLPRFEERENE